MATDEPVVFYNLQPFCVQVVRLLQICFYSAGQTGKKTGEAGTVSCTGEAGKRRRSGR